MIDLATASELDLWKATLEAYPFRKQFNRTIVTSQHGFPITNNWFREGKVTVDGGTQIEDRIQLDVDASAQMTLPNAERSYDVANLMAEIRVPYRLATAYWVANRIETNTNRDWAKLVDITKARRTGAMYSMATLLQRNGVGVPASAADPYGVYGMKYWVVPITGAQVTAGQKGHIGQNPVLGDGSTATTVAGLDSRTAQYSLYRNYAARWTNGSATAIDMTEDDIDLICEMLLETHFEGPMTAKDVDAGRYDDFRHYCGKILLLAMERKARMSNENLGATIGTFRGTVTIKGNPLVRLDELDADATHPLFSINHAYFKTVVQKGTDMYEHPPMNSQKTPDTFVFNVDIYYNHICRNRRAQSNISLVAAA